jgi:hypothetical protein
VIAERFAAQMLAGPPARDPVAVVERLLAVQGQDARGARLAIRARSAGLTAADVNRAMTEDRSLVITWLNRGTLHLVRSDDYPWLHALTTPPLLTASARRLAQEGVTPDAAERAVEVIERSLADDGPLTRYQLRARVEEAGVRTEGQALVHQLLLASLRGLIVRGPMVGKQHAYVLVRDWLGEVKPVPRERAVAELARRYLVGHGPADARDLAKWSGLPLRDARAGLESISRDLDVRPDGLVSLAGRQDAAPPPPARLLGAFDPVLMGWTTREPILGRHDATVVSGGLFRPFALLSGRGVATWRVSYGQVELEPFARLSRADRAALESDAHDVARFLALSRPVDSSR